MSQKKILAVALLVFVFSSAVTSSLTAFASEDFGGRKVGVKVGDWALYGNINVTWGSNDPNATPEPSLILANDTAWFKHVVTEIAGIIVYFLNVTHFRDGTETTSSAWADVAGGFGNGTLMFVSAGLDEGESLFQEDYPSGVFINETLSRTYAGELREVNHLNLTEIHRHGLDTDTPEIIQISINYYWDKTTGILTERQGSFVNQTGSYLTSWHKSEMIVETSLWSSDPTPPPPPPPPDNNPPPVTDASEGFPLWLVGVAIITVLGVLLLYGRRGKSRPKVRKHRKRISRAHVKRISASMVEA